MSKTPAVNANPAAEEKIVRIFHTGDAHGPLSTKHGLLRPGQSLEVPESTAATLTRAYAHIKLAADVIPGGAALSNDAKDKLEALVKAAGERVAVLEKTLEDQRLEHAKALDAAAAEKATLLEQLEAAKEGTPLADLGPLHAALREFLKAGSKKDLEALQEKHKDLVPAE